MYGGHFAAATHQKPLSGFDGSRGPEEAPSARLWREGVSQCITLRLRLLPSHSIGSIERGLAGGMSSGWDTPFTVPLSLPPGGSSDRGRERGHRGGGGAGAAAVAGAGGCSGQTGAGGLPHVASSADSVGWHRGSGCSAERGRNQTGCYYVAACGSSRPTARPRARPRWLLCSVEWSGASAMSRPRLRIRTAPRTAERGSDHVEGARALTGDRGEGKRREGSGMGAHEHGGRGNGGWERGAPLRGEITLVAENGRATLRWGRRKRRREREEG